MVRLKHRFLIGQILPVYQKGESAQHRVYNLHKIIDLIRQKISELYGEMGIGDFGQQLVIKYYEQEYSRLLVIKIPRGHQKHVQFALSCISSIEETPVTIRTLHTSSCPRTCIQKLTPMIKTFIEHNPKVKNLNVEEALLQTLNQTLVDN
jgi:RNase P/RNase MRP subunit POP5